MSEYDSKGGMYKVGKDIAPGEYYIVSGVNTYYEVSKSSRDDSIVFNDNVDYNVYVNLIEGEYLKIDGGSLLTVDDAPETDFNGSLAKGMYKVGRDIPAGEYRLECDDITYYAVLKSPRSEIIFNDNVDYGVYITLKDGEYLEFTGGTLFSAGDLVNPPSTEIKEYLDPGNYAVGRDIPAGEYYLICENRMYYEVSRTSRGGNILFNDNVDYNVYVTVKNGEYLKVDGGSIISADNAPEVNFKNSLSKGMYKVGRDISAGEYRLECDYTTYYEVIKASRGGNILFNDNVSSDVYITVEDGEYLHFNGGKLLKADENNRKFEFPLSDGVYKVGRDIPAGEYYLKNPDASYYEISRNSRSGGIVYNGHADYDIYLVLLNDDYLRFDGGNLFPVEDVPANDFDGMLKNGMFKVGRDLPKGEYCLEDCGGPGNAEVFKDIRKSGRFYNRFGKKRYITLNYGHYIRLNDALLHSTEDVFTDISQDGFYYPGMYKVGIDLKEGKYFVEPIEGKGYYDIVLNSTPDYSGRVEDKFIDSKTDINLYKGQYIILEDAKLSLPFFKQDKTDSKDDEKIPEETENQPSFNREIDDLKSRYKMKDEKVRKIIEKRFTKDTLTYERFISALDASYKLFKKQMDNIDNIISLADEFDYDVAVDVEENIRMLEILIRKLDDLFSEIAVSFSKSGEKEMNDFFEDIDLLIDSVKDYD